MEYLCVAAPTICYDRKKVKDEKYSQLLKEITEIYSEETKQTKREIERQANDRTDRHTDRKADRQTNRKGSKQTEEFPRKN